MKKLIQAIVIFLSVEFAYAQNTGINTKNPDASALLELMSTDKGFLLPRVTLQNPTDGTTIASPANGLTVYNTNDTGMTEGFYTNYGTSIAPVWTHLGPEKGSPVVVFAGKLNSDFQQTFEAGSGGGVNSQTKIPGSSMDIMVDEYNTFNTSTGAFTPRQNGIHRIEMAYDYSYVDINAPGTNTSLSVDNIRPIILYGLYNETDGVWIFRNYEYLIVDREIGRNAGKSNYTIGYIDMDTTKEYAFYFVCDVSDADYAAGKRVVIKATNSGTTGTSDATFFVIEKIVGL